MNTTKSIPAHLAPHACYVCGGSEHAPTSLHAYLSNADADAKFAAEPTTTYSPEAAYVAQRRPG